MITGDHLTNEARHLLSQEGPSHSVSRQDAQFTSSETEPAGLADSVTAGTGSEEESVPGVRSEFWRRSTCSVSVVS